MLDPFTFLIYLTVYLFIILFIAYVVLLGDKDCHKNTPIASLHSFLTTRVPTFLYNDVLYKCCGEQRADNFTKSFSRFFEKWVMPVGYLLLLAAGLTLVSYTVIPRLPELEVIDGAVSPCPRSRFFCHRGTATSFPPKTPPSAVYVYAVVALLSWLSVFLVDPATITADTFLSLAPLFPYDNCMFVEGNNCRTCLLPKLPRSKHCATCDRCVARFDHHCGWVGNCVGFYNTKNFVIFLTIHCIMIMHGILLTAELVYAKMLYLIAGDFIYAPTNTPIKSFSFKVAFLAETNICALLIVLVLTFIMVFSFLAYHVYLIFQNKTTNETAKWEAIMKAARKYELEHNGKSIGQAMTEEALEDAANAGTSAEKALKELPVFDEKGLPINIYNKNLRSNFFQVFFPGWFRSRCTLSDEERSLWEKALDGDKDD